MKKSRRKPKLINGNRALMASRTERKDSRDFFPTPPFATRALMESVLPHLGINTTPPWTENVWEPACGEGHMADVLLEYSDHVIATDIVARGYGGSYFGSRSVDFLTTDIEIAADWIVTNPPYVKAEQFALRALKRARTGVAIFVRTQFLETIGRYERLFSPHPPTVVAHFAERVPLHKGRWEPDGTTATSYCWLVWVRRANRQWLQPKPTFWIPPGQRKALSRPDDRARFAAWSLPQQEAAE